MENSDIILKEYDAVKTEIADSIKTRNQILSFGQAIAALLINSIVTIINKDGYKPLGQFLLLVILPSLSISILLMWLGELERMIRAGNYILLIEKKINEELGKDVLMWESSRRSNEFKISYAYKSVLAVFIAFALLPLILLMVKDNDLPFYFFLYSPIITIIFLFFFHHRYITYIRTNNLLDIKNL